MYSLIGGPDMNLSRRDPASVADNRDKVLIVEDSKFFRRLLRRTVEFRTGLVPVVASSLAEARNVIENGPEGFLLSLLDLNLSDSPRGEIVDYIQSQHIPAIVFTGQFDEATRETVLAKNVIDYVIKSNRSSLDQIIAQINRFHKNRDVTVLVVDDSRSVNEYICRLLASHGFNVLSAGNGEEALAVFGDNPGIAMVITDYNMPSIDGFELISRLREGHSKSELAIIGLSGGGDAILSARFLKIGANDYLNKPFLPEEFYCRVNQNIEIMETIRDLKDSATRDFLTGLYNRRYLMESGTQRLEAAKRQ
ncbi:MAG TPA: response regulator, partial [Planctomycetaceae bacterium]|nr:response regulator [Planctomycetaceae bacterium]